MDLPINRFSCADLPFAWGRNLNITMCFIMKFLFDVSKKKIIYKINNPFLNLIYIIFK